MNYESFLSELPLQLNAQQQEAVQAVTGPVLLLAVPGSGKTTVLVTRLGYMVKCCNIPFSSILTLTYTVAATKDMRNRFARLFGEELAEKLEFRTINGLCSRIIYEYGRQIGKAPFALEQDEKVLISILSSLYLKYEEEYPTESDLKNIKTLITYIKNMLLSEDEINRLGEEAGCHLLDIYHAYCMELKSRNRMDYDDQMIYAYKLLRLSPNLLSYYQNLYPYICVDEAQDTSKIQHKIIALLASKSENLFMVGDEDQSIYGFRAAYPEALLSFETDHPSARVLLMEENFRSNANIVKASDLFIQKNTLRHEKHMKPSREASSDIKVIELKSRASQYSYLLKVAEDCTEETAVLYRDNESAIPLIDLLERSSIPYRIRNAELSFFTNRVVTDIQNILRFAFDQSNADLFELIYYKLSTYLNKQTALKVCEISRNHKISIFSAIFDHLHNLKPLTRKSLKALETHFCSIKQEPPQKAIRRIVQFMGYGEYLQRSGINQKKLFILKTIAAKEETIPGFLNRMDELRLIIQSKKTEYNCPFLLSTIHASKGLEYDNVYLIDVQDGLFPESVPPDLKQAEESELSLYEEERRLFYVGITRAKNNLYLFRTAEEATFTKQLINKKKHKPTPPKSSAPKQVVTRPTPKEKFDESAFHDFAEQLCEGLVVTHKKFGQGVILSLDAPTVTILFGEQKKTFHTRILFQNHLLIS